MKQHDEAPSRARVDTVIFDWAGTVVDFGSFAPTQVMVDVFTEQGVPISLAEARGPMGVAKWDHIQALGRNPAIAARWQDRHGRPMSTDDVDALYATFMPLQVERVGGTEPLAKIGPVARMRRQAMMDVNRREREPVSPAQGREHVQQNDRIEAARQREHEPRAGEDMAGERVAHRVCGSLTGQGLP